MSDLYLTRRVFTNKSTVGKLIMDDLEIWTLEDTARKMKVYGETCIPSGCYGIEIRMSTRYQKPMPYLLNVPFFEGIMIHPGNTDKDSHGCILVGQTHPSEDLIGESKLAFDKLFERIRDSKGLRIHVAGGYTKEEFEKSVKNKVV